MKFENIYAEAAYVIACHGFEQGQFGTHDDTAGSNSLVVVCSTHLHAIGEADLANRLNDYALTYTWIHEDTAGFVTVKQMGTGVHADDTVAAFGRAELLDGVPSEAVLNIWGTDTRDVGEGFCKSCEKDRGHYSTCPERIGA